MKSGNMRGVIPKGEQVLKIYPDARFMFAVIWCWLRGSYFELTATLVEEMEA